MKIKQVTINSFLNREKYKLLIQEISQQKRGDHKTEPKDYQLLKRYDVVEVGNTVKLIYPVAGGSSSIKYNVQKEDIFDVIHDAHLAIGHGGRNGMIKETQRKYKNITAESIMLYISLCVPCLFKSKNPEKDVPSVNISLRECARKASLFGGQGYRRCNCKTSCRSNLSSCRKSN